MPFTTGIFLIILKNLPRVLLLLLERAFIVVIFVSGIPVVVNKNLVHVLDELLQRGSLTLEPVEHCLRPLHESAFLRELLAVHEGVIKLIESMLIAFYITGLVIVLPEHVLERVVVVGASVIYAVKEDVRRIAYLVGILLRLGLELGEFGYAIHKLRVLVPDRLHQDILVNVIPVKNPIKEP